MRKILIGFLCINLLSLPVYSLEITDDLAESLDRENLKIKPAKTVIITDDFVENTLDKNLKIQIHNDTLIKDDFAEQNVNKNSAITRKKPVFEDIPVTERTIENSQKKIVYNKNLKNEIPVKIKTNFTTKQKIDEGDYIEFETIKDVKINGKFFKSGSVVKARVETISMNKPMGVPADVSVGNFSINEIPLYGQIYKIGANRTLWVYPSVYTLLTFFGAGLLFIPIRGGHAKIKTKETFILYSE